MSLSRYVFGTTAKTNIRNAVLALTLGYVATWQTIGDETYLELGSQYAQRKIKLHFGKDGNVDLDVVAGTYDLTKLLKGWAKPAQVAAQGEFTKWLTKGDNLEA